MILRCLTLLAIVATLTSARAVALPNRVPQAPASISASPSRVNVGAPVTITATLPVALTAVITGTVQYGDGTPGATVGPGTSVLVHRYSEPGAYAVSLNNSSGALIASTTVVVIAQTALVPIGTIYSVTPSLAPVLAGSTTTLIVTYSLVAPPSAFVNNVPQLYLYADLLDADGRIVRRSDPYPFVASTAAGSATQVVRVNYDVPVDAAGHYQLHAYLATATGSAVARAEPIPFDVLGGPDPEPSAVAKEHANGSIELGPNAGTAATFNAGATLALAWPCDTLALSGVFDPLSGRSDPILSFSSGNAAALTSPDSATVAKATTKPCGNSKYAALAGRTQAELPYILGGGETLRGFDASDVVGPWTYQSGYGYSQVGSTAALQYGSLFDVQRAFANQGLLRMTLFSNSAEGANSSTEVGEIAVPVVKHLLLDVSGDTGTNDDAADARLTYALGHTTANLEYVNAAPNTTTAGGPGAIADRDGFNSTFALPLSALDSLSFGYNDNATHSVVSRATDAFATLAIATHSSLSSTLTYRHDTATATDSDVASNQMAFTLAQSSKVWSWNANYVLVGSNDLMNAFNDSTTRTGAISFMRQASRHTLGFGITSTDITGNALTATTQTSETATYGFPFDTKPNGRGFEVQFSGANNNITALMGQNITRTLSGLLSFHLNSHIAIGIRTELDYEKNPFPPALSRAGAIRLRLDFAQ